MPSLPSGSYPSYRLNCLPGSLDQMSVDPRVHDVSCDVLDGEDVGRIEGIQHCDLRQYFIKPHVFREAVEHKADRTIGGEGCRILVIL